MLFKVTTEVRRVREICSLIKRDRSYLPKSAGIEDFKSAVRRIRNVDPLYVRSLYINGLFDYLKETMPGIHTEKLQYCGSNIGSRTIKEGQEDLLRVLHILY